MKIRSIDARGGSQRRAIRLESCTFGHHCGGRDRIYVEAPERRVRLERFDKVHKGTIIRAKFTRAMMPL